MQVVDGKTLRIRGEWKREEVQKGDSCNFMRPFRLPQITNVDDVKAQLQDGVLTVTFVISQKPKQQVYQIENASPMREG